MPVSRFRGRMILFGSVVLAMVILTIGGLHSREQSAPSLRWRASGHLSEARLIDGCGNSSPPTGWKAVRRDYHLGLAHALTVLADWSDEPALTLESIRRR